MKIQWNKLIVGALHVAAGAFVKHGWIHATVIHWLYGAVLAVVAYFIHNPPPADEIKSDIGKITGTLKLLLVGSLAACLVTGCAGLQPGADPLVVRAEQLEQGANATFETFLTMDNTDRELWKTNFPAAHNFAEYLREPVMINGTNYPRDLAFIISLDNVKLAYKAGKASKDDLTLAINTLQAALTQSSLYITTASTNH